MDNYGNGYRLNLRDLYDNRRENLYRLPSVEGLEYEHGEDSGSYRLTKKSGCFDRSY